MRAKVLWVGGMRFVGSADSGHAVVMDSKSDEEPALGSSPMEMVLMALGGCSSVDVVEILKKMRVGLHSVEVVIHAERANDAPRVFTKADMEFVLAGEGLTPEAAKRAVDLSMDKYCSVAAMLKRGGVLVSYRYRLKDTAGAEETNEAPKPSLPPAAVEHPQVAHEVPFPGSPGPFRGDQK